MPKFKVVNPDAPEEIDFYQDIPLVDPDTGTDQLDSDGNILVKRYVNHTVSLKGINAVKDALPTIRTNTQNLEELYQYAHTQSEAHQTAINNNASAIVDLQTSASEMALDLETLTNKINGIQGIDIDDLKDYVYTQVPLIKNSYLPLVGGTITGNLTIEEGTITGSLTGVASNATADVNNKELTSYVADIMGANAQLSISKGDGTTSVVSINNVLNATKASQNASGYALANTIVKSIAISGRTITVTKIDGTSYTLTTQDTNTVYTKLSQFANDVGFITSAGSCAHATSADSATNATNATNANHATTANSATTISQKVDSNAKTHTNYNINGTYVPTMNFLSYWNGAYASNNASNLTYCAQGTIIGSNNIGSQSVKYATSAGSVAWNNVSGRPTKVSQFTNDSGYITGGYNFASGVKVNGYTITVG